MHIRENVELQSKTLPPNPLNKHILEKQFLMHFLDPGSVSSVKILFEGPVLCSWVQSALSFLRVTSQLLHIADFSVCRAEVSMRLLSTIWALWEFITSPSYLEWEMRFYDKVRIENKEWKEGKGRDRMRGRMKQVRKIVPLSKACLYKGQ